MTDEAVLREREDIERVIAGQTTCHLLQHNAEQHGDRPALSWKQDGTWRTLDWRQYRQRVAQVALGLRSLGVGRGDTVAIMASNRWEHVVADQAIVHLGATSTTFYQTLPPEQIRHVAADCGAKVAIVEDRDLMRHWRGIRGELAALEHLVMLGHADELSDAPDILAWDVLVARGQEALAADRSLFEDAWREVTPGDVATLIYTSGTTGPPKGVPITHHNVLFEAESLVRISGVGRFATGVSYLPLAHIAERELSLYVALKQQYHIYFCPVPTQVLEYLLEARPTIFVGVPRVWEKVKAGINAKIDVEEHDTRRALAQRAIRMGTAVVRLHQRGRRPSPLLRAEHALLDQLVLAKIRAGIGMDRCEFAVTSTAPMPLDVAEFFAAIGLPLIEIWGMTELTGAATCNPPDDIRIGTVGKALPGVELRTAEDDGEVLVRGPIAVDGYHNLPDATAALIDADGWLHSGDVGRIDADGYLRIVDRKKELIITAGGKNISPANIEALLRQHPLIGQALAYGDRRPYVVALIVLDAEAAPAWAAQRGIASPDLPELAEHPVVRAEIERAVEATNQRLARAEQIKRFTIIGREWTAESEELTPSLKLKRRVVHDRYADTIQTLYGG
ncbi:MAG TPA: long-chain fatty acid--CoA ligase [Nitriliruptorales bacterium]|nr:long-chain fatty acid--CoA ligase [Nitriliruptorales bacterium]